MKALDRAAEARLLAYEAETQLARHLAAMIAATYRRFAGKVSRAFGSSASRYPSL